jgi:hypothetical protein
VLIRISCQEDVWGSGGMAKCILDSVTDRTSSYTLVTGLHAPTSFARTVASFLLFSVLRVFKLRYILSTIFVIRKPATNFDSTILYLQYIVKY